jgi:serine/threonine protein kinase
LRHSGIVTVHEVQTLDGLGTIVSDFIQGVTLKKLLEVRRLTFREAAELIAAVADAVDYAHSMGLVHLGRSLVFPPRCAIITATVAPFASELPGEAP